MTWFDQLLSYFSAANAVAIMLLGLFVVVTVIFIRLQFDRDSSFDLEDLICHNGRLDEKKFARFGAWVLSSWGFVYLMVKNPESLPEWYFVGYMGVWVSNAIFEKYVNAKNNNNNNNDYYRYYSRPPDSLPRPPEPPRPPL